MRQPKFISFSEPQHSPEPTRLLARVSVLVDCLEASATLAGYGNVVAHDEAAQSALAAASEVERRLAEQAERIAALERLAMTDELTGLLNRRGFLAEFRHALAAARRYDEDGVLVYMDMDGFKAINDTYGHAAGDEVLRHLASILKLNVRETDHIGRMGGDEFAILLTRTAWEDGLTRAQALEKAVNDTVVEREGRLLAVKASFGVQKYGADDDGDALLGRADNAMYRIKRVRAELNREPADA